MFRIQEFNKKKAQLFSNVLEANFVGALGSIKERKAQIDPVIIIQGILNVLTAIIANDKVLPFTMIFCKQYFVRLMSNQTQTINNPF